MNSKESLCQKNYCFKTDRKLDGDGRVRGKDLEPFLLRREYSGTPSRFLFLLRPRKTKGVELEYPVTKDFLVRKDRGGLSGVRVVEGAHGPPQGHSDLPRHLPAAGTVKPRRRGTRDSMQELALRQTGVRSFCTLAPKRGFLCLVLGSSVGSLGPASASLPGLGATALGEHTWAGCGPDT